MKRFLIVLTTALLTSTSLAHAEAVPSSFTIKGTGFGHGVGLSQIGAKGQALAGKSAVEILNYYFPTSQVIPVSDTATIRVNLAHQVSNIKISLTKNLLNNQWSLTAGDTGTPITGSSPLIFSMLGQQISAGNFGAADYWTLRWNESTTTVVVPTDATSTTISHGFLQLRPVLVKGIGYRIEVTNTLNLRDQYLWGVSEVPSSWPAAAMQAQAIASRTYALSRMSAIRKECDCNIYNQKYDQVYAGFSKESEPKYGALWKAAVSATNVDTNTALAITYQGKPINVFFSSSSGGATATAKDVWGTDYPYLVSVPDPWSLDAKLNPKYNAWSRTISQNAMANAFGLPDVARYVVTARSSTAAVLSLTATSSRGVKAKLAVGLFKSRLKIPSSWFDLPTTVVIPQQTESSTATN